VAAEGRSLYITSVHLCSLVLYELSANAGEEAALAVLPRAGTARLLPRLDTPASCALHATLDSIRQQRSAYLRLRVVKVCGMPSLSTSKPLMRPSSGCWVPKALLIRMPAHRQGALPQLPGMLPSQQTGDQLPDHSCLRKSIVHFLIFDSARSAPLAVL